MSKNRDTFNAKLSDAGKSKNLSGRMNSEKIKDAVFCGVVLLIPTIQFLVFYIGVNFNSLALSLKSYDTATGKYAYVG